MATTQNLGDSAQTPSRDANLDPSTDNLNALKNAHLTPRAIKRVQSGLSINPPKDDSKSFTKSPAPKDTQSKTGRAPTTPPKKNVTPSPKPTPKRPSVKRTTSKPTSKPTPTPRQQAAKKGAQTRSFNAYYKRLTELIDTDFY